MPIRLAASLFMANILPSALTITPLVSLLIMVTVMSFLSMVYTLDSVFAM